MAVRVNKQTFAAAGREFDTKEEAERHDKLYSARIALEDADHAYQMLLAESCLTADRKLFNFGLFRDYWWVFGGGYGGMPSLMRLNYSCRSWTVRDGEDVVEIKDSTADRGDGRYIPIRELYTDEGNAKRAMLAKRREWLSGIMRLIEEDEAKGI